MALALAEPFLRIAAQTANQCPELVGRCGEPLPHGGAQHQGHAEIAAPEIGIGADLEIGIALATEPRLLCLDEPTAGMSAAETHETMGLVRRIAGNLSILIVEHDMQVVMELAHRITVFHYGHVLAEGSPADIQGNPRVQEVYLKT